MTESWLEKFIRYVKKTRRVGYGPDQSLMTRVALFSAGKVRRIKPLDLFGRNSMVLFQTISKYVTPAIIHVAFVHRIGSRVPSAIMYWICTRRDDGADINSRERR